MKDRANIEQILNSYADGQLSVRQANEVQRIIANDPEIAKIYNDIIKCRTLVNSLPQENPPPELFESIKASLERQSLLEDASQNHKRHYDGVIHLRIRKILSVAAAVILVGTLALIVFKILIPSPAKHPKPVARNTAVKKVFKPQPPKTFAKAPVPQKSVEVPPAAQVAKAQPVIAEPAQTQETKTDAVPQAVQSFAARLEIQTSNPQAVIAYLNRTIEEIVPENQWSSVSDVNNPKPHQLACSSRHLQTLMSELGKIWDKLDKADLYFTPSQPGQEIAINSVLASQINEILKKPQNQIELAKQFASLNASAVKDVNTAVAAAVPDLNSLPKPVLTSAEKTLKPAESLQDGEKIDFIFVVNSK